MSVNVKSKRALLGLALGSFIQAHSSLVGAQTPATTTPAADDAKTEQTTTPTTNTATETVEAKIKCKGGNSCKGKSGCHGANNACGGKNSCKGKGWVMLNKADCTKAGGTEDAS